ncbi:MAG: DNA polymerase III subunit alpha [Thermoflexales bacterium]|nr:DNA polymerase III subunit alpha [Thermoflexales bacterium]
MSFVHLHNHSEYSMLDGLSKVKDLARAAAAMNMPAVALTDHGVMHGVIEFYDACHEVGIKPIIGMEAYLCKRGQRMRDHDNKFDRSPHHLLLLAMNQTGYKNLMRLATLAQLEGFHYKPRIDHLVLAEHSEGLICTSGCPSAEIPRLLLEDKVEEAWKVTRWYLDVFRDRFYIELQEHNLPEFAKLNQMLLALARELSIPVIATNDAHYVRREDALPHDLLLCVQTSATYRDPNRMRFNDDSYYLKSAEEMRALFEPICPEAISNTLDLAARCDVKLKDNVFHLPHFQRPARFASDEDYLRYLCEIGFEVRYGIPARDDGTWVHEVMPPQPEDGFITAEEAARNPEAAKGLTIVGRPKAQVYFGEDQPIKLTALSSLALPSADTHPAMTPRRLRERLRFEVETIIRMNFATYMLIVWDLIRFCRKEGIWWDVRGSAAGSMVSHVLMLTNIEPVSNDLYFERFLNPARVTMPDIDMDFPDDQRYRLGDYTIDRYGAEKVAQIITFGTLAARAALKDIGRVLDIPLSEVNRVTELVPNIPGKPITLKEALEQVPQLKQLYEREPHLRELYDKAMLVEGTVRNAGTHAAGVVIADKPLIEYVPLHRLTGTPLTPRLNAVTQFEMTHLESIGLLKMDYLGLSMLTIMRRACELIAQRHGKRYDLNTIPIHDPIIYDTLSKGDVVGVFQVEGPGMRNLMMQMKPRRFEHIVAALSLFRPGPMEYIPTYIRRMHGEEPVVYHHPDLEPALKETYGILVYQEQIMRVARDLAGYSMGEADMIRKAVAKKNKEQLDKHRTKFIQGAVERGYPAEVAEKVWNDIEFFARYGFNKSHAAVYASITCQTAWLKANYPLEYFCALLTVESGNLEKMSKIIADAREHGIRLLPPDVNRSEEGFTIEDAPAQQSGHGAIRFGLLAIKNVGEGPVRAILEARRRGGPFRSLDDFVRRVDTSAFNRRVLEALIKAGAMDCFGERAQLLAGIDAILAAATTARRAAESGQGMLFGELGSAEAGLVLLPRRFKPLSRREQLAAEKELLGTYVSDHPLEGVLRALQGYITHTSNQLSPADNGQKVRLAGVVMHVRPHTTRDGKAMGFAEIEDLFGRVELTLFPRAWEQYRELLVRDQAVLIDGKAEVEEGRTPKVIVDRVSTSVEITRGADELVTEPPQADELGAQQWFASAEDAALVSVESELETSGESEWREMSASAPSPKPLADAPAAPQHANHERAEIAETHTAPLCEPTPVYHIETLDILQTQATPAVVTTDEVNNEQPPEPNPHPRAQDLPILAAQPPIKVVLRRNGDLRSDIDRLEAAVRVLRRYPGDCPFIVELRGGSKSYVIEFPNDAVRDCPELERELTAILGARCIERG